MITRIALAQIERDMLLQPRAELHRDWIEDYAQDMVAGARFPPIIVFHDGEKCWLADGFHRVHAAEIAGLAVLPADIRKGTHRDALLFSLQANREHGHRRSNDDKRRSIDVMLNDPEWRKLPDREIARHCGVDHKTVAARREAKAAIWGNSPDRRFASRGGTTYVMNTAAIGTITAAPAAAPAFDWEAARIRNAAMEAIRALAAQPPPDAVMAAWMQANSYGEPVDLLDRAAAWLGQFIALYRVCEPVRWARVERTMIGSTADAAE